MHPKTKRFIIILALITFLGIGGLIWLSNRRVQITPMLSFPQTSPSPSSFYLPPFLQPTPSSLATPKTASPSSSEELVQQLLLQLPHKEAGFTIEYFASQDQFIVQINQGPFQENQNAAKDWFSDQDLDPETLNILWTAPKEVGH
jgi:hypothetical protein